MEILSSLLLLALPAFSHCATADEGGRNSNEFFQSFLSDFQLWRQETNPERASLEGLHQYDLALRDTSPAGAARARERCVEFAGKASAILKVYSTVERRFQVTLFAACNSSELKYYVVPWKFD